MVRNKLTKIVLALSLALTIFNIILNSAYIANANAISSVSTSEAIGSPILNKQFSANNWNKWEMTVFGIFLSNFCVPLVDSYESAFSYNSTYGTKGRGLEAMKFGSGNDPENNEVINSLLTSAIGIQTNTGNQEIYVAYTKIIDGVLEEKSNPNTGALIRPARFSDLFFITENNSVEEKSWLDTSDITNIVAGAISEREYSIKSIRNGSLPTFYINSDGTYIEILDYTDSWDVQMIAAMINYAETSGYKDDFYKAYTEMYGADANGSQSHMIKMDAFGNIVSGNNSNIVIPAAVNQHLTTEKQINILNSWIVNGTTSNITNNIINTGSQPYELQDLIATFADMAANTIVSKIFQGDRYVVGGVPAFASKSSTFLGIGDKKELLESGSLVLFKDTDSLRYKKNNYTLGTLMLEIMSKRDISSDIPLKIEVIKDISNKESSASANEALGNTVWASYMLSNQVKVNNNISLSNIITPQGKKYQMFNDSVMVANQIKPSTDKESNRHITRQITDFIYQVYKSGSISTTYGEISSDMVEQWLKSSANDSDIREVYKKIFNYFKAYNTGYKDIEYNPKGDSLASNTGADETNRYTIVYMPSQELRECASALGIKSGEEFSMAVSYIYATYLNYYGINTSALGNNSTKLNTRIFSKSQAKDFSVESISGIKSREQKEEELINMSYLMLSNSDEGKKYRDSINQSSIEAFITNQYERIVNSDGNKTGFMAVQDLENNPFTSPVIGIYHKVVVVILTISTAIIVISGIIRRKQAVWFVISLIITVNMALIVPYIGNISSHYSNKAIQSMFKDKMTFWSIHHQIDDYTYVKNQIEKESNESKILSEMLADFSMITSNRNLLIKNDISSKVNQKLSTEYQEIQKLKTARWILPILLNQINNGSSVQSGMINMMDDASNIYMYYNENHKEAIGIVSSYSESKGNSGTDIKSNERVRYYADYTNTSHNIGYNSINYRHIGYYNSTYNEMSHTYFYLLKAVGGAAPLVISENGIVDKGNIDSYKNYIEKTSVTNINSWKQTADVIEEYSDEYLRDDISTVHDSYGFLLNSESIYNTMYHTVQDSFSSGETTGSLIGKIQGQYKENANGVKVRDNFMYATDYAGNPTGYVRDILDLEEVLTNNLPYMYKMTISAGGFDGKSGVLGEREITNNSYYDGMNSSWLFRSNWAIKLFENDKLNKRTVVSDADGNKYTVDNMIRPECYPSNRPMIFSRAQQKAYGLSDSDLSYVELKCIKINEDTAISWTSLINYAGTSGISREILIRQMAIDATINFNKEFSNSTKISEKYQLYPQSIDLKNISFDYIMQMIIVNSTTDSGYTYNNTMATLINKNSLITAVVLMLNAGLCASIVPLVRNVVSLVLLLLSILAVCRSVVQENKDKAKIILGTFISQVIYTIINVAYYSVVATFTKLNSQDEVVNIGMDGAYVQSGNALWSMIVILVITIVYIVAMITEIKIFYLNRDDMGLNTYLTTFSNISNNIIGYVSEKKEKMYSYINKDYNYKYKGDFKVNKNNESNESSKVQFVRYQEEDKKDSNSNKSKLNYSGKYNEEDDSASRVELEKINKEIDNQS